MQRIEFVDFLLIAERHTHIPAERLARIPSVIHLAQAALAAPWAGYGDYELYPTLPEKAAIYCSRIVGYHPLTDGNKRVGLQLMVEFVQRNDATFTHHPDWENTAETIENLAAGSIAEPDFIVWVAARIT